MLIGSCSGWLTSEMTIFRLECAQIRSTSFRYQSVVKCDPVYFSTPTVNPPLRFPHMFMLVPLTLRHNLQLLLRQFSLVARPYTVSSLSTMRSLLRKSKPLTDPIVWVDCEMTGLDVNNDHIIEICCIITDGDLNVVDENAYESTVYYLKDRLAQMDEWCTTTHTASGLIDKILENEDRSLEVVKNELLGYIKKYVTAPRKAVLAGNSIHMDRYFMMKEMPEVIDWLHYRNIDVSTIMEFGSRHNPELMKLCPKKKQAHTAKDDILESIDQLKWYRKYYFKSGDDTAELVKAMKKGDI